MKTIDVLINDITRENEDIEAIRRNNRFYVSVEGRDLIIEIDPKSKIAELQGLKSIPKNPAGLIRKTYASYPGMLQLCTYLVKNDYEIR